MCVPALATAMPYIMGGLSAASTLLSAQQSNKANEQSEKAVARASQAETVRQKEFADRKMALISEEQQQGYTPEKRAEQLAAAAAQREESFATATAGIGTAPVYNDSAPEVLKSDLANAMMNALKRGKDYAKTLANLGAYGDVGQQHETSLGRTAQNIGVLDGFSQGSLNALSGELDAAGRAGQSAANNAGLLSGLGALGSVYAGKLYGEQNALTQAPAPVVNGVWKMVR